MKSIHSAEINAATDAATGEKGNGEGKFLTVHELGAFLQVPVSWVYGRLRERSTETLLACALNWKATQTKLGGPSITLLLVLTGSRIGQLLALRWGNVGLDARRK